MVIREFLNSLLYIIIRILLHWNYYIPTYVYDVIDFPINFAIVFYD